MLCVLALIPGNLSHQYAFIHTETKEVYKKFHEMFIKEKGFSEIESEVAFQLVF